MKNINKVMVVGNLTRDASIRRTQGDLAIMEVGIAVNDSKRNQSTGEYEDYANFFDCVMIGERAEKLAPMLTKGLKVVIEGKLRYNSWEKEGQKRSKVEIIIGQVDFLSPKGQQQPTDSMYDEDIPF